MARRSDKFIARNVFYIITNGVQTECNYFKLLKAKRSVYDVKIIFENADPLGLVQYAQRYIAEANQVWCVFDIDYTYKDKRLIPALKQAEESGIKIAYSNVAFEVWLIKAMLQIKDLMMKSEKLKESAKANTESDFAFSYFDGIDDALIEGLSQNQDFFSLLLSNDEMKKEVLGIFISEIYKSLREEAK